MLLEAGEDGPWVLAARGGGPSWATKATKLARAERHRRQRDPRGGLEALVQGGADLCLGPFAALSIGQYRTRLFTSEGSAKPSVPAASTSDVADRAWHGWLQLGVRGTFDLWRRPMTSRPSGDRSSVWCGRTRPKPPGSAR